MHRVRKAMLDLPGILRRKFSANHIFLHKHTAQNSKNTIYTTMPLTLYIADITHCISDILCVQNKTYQGHTENNTHPRTQLTLQHIYTHIHMCVWVYVCVYTDTIRAVKIHIPGTRLASAQPPASPGEELHEADATSRQMRHLPRI